MMIQKFRFSCRSARLLVPLALAGGLLPLLPPTASAETYTGDVAHFRPLTGQPLFPAGNITVFKQFMVSGGFSERIAARTSIDLLFTSLEFGGELGASLDAAFGLEVGLCFGGNATYDLGFQPSITLPDKYPYDIPIPLTVSEGLLKNFVSPLTLLPVESKFETTFPPLGKAYADLIFDVGAKLDATACVFGCFDVIDLDISTCDIPALPDGTKLFKPSKRCDLALTEKPRCSIELASFNRDDDNALRMLNVGVDNFAEFLEEPYKEFSPLESSPGIFTTNNVANNEFFVAGASPVRSKITEGRAVRVTSSGSLPSGLDTSRIYYVKDAEVDDTSPSNPQGVFFKLATSSGGAVINISSMGSGTQRISAFDPNEQDDPLDGCYGTLSLAVPTVSTSSAGSEFNTAEALRSSGAEDIMGIGIDVAKIAGEFLKPLPPLSDSGSVGPVGWDYTLASVELGPAVQLKTDFEMTWDLEVTQMTFSAPGVKINGQGPEVMEFNPAPGTVHLTNCGPKALPMIQLINEVPIQVSITYTLKPKLQTAVAVPIIGQLDYQFFGAGANIDHIGRLGFGPVVDDSHKFKLGDFSVYDGAPSPIDSVGTGTINFEMMADGPPSFDWNPEQLAGAGGRNWTTKVGNVTNWEELLSNINSSFPGENGTDSSHAMIAKDKPTELDPRLRTSLRVDSLMVAPGNELLIHQVASSGNPDNELGVVGGFVENNGKIDILTGSLQSSLKLDSPDGVLCGVGEVNLRTLDDSETNSRLIGPSGPAFTFCNYNTIRGSGEAMRLLDVNSTSFIHNVGTFRSERQTNPNTKGRLSTDANGFLNLGVLESAADSTLSVRGNDLANREGSRISASGVAAQTFLVFDRVEHAGLIQASNGGRVSTFVETSGTRGALQAGLSMTQEAGFFRSEDENSRLTISDFDVVGGCFFAESGGRIIATDTTFDGSVFHIGDRFSSVIDEASGTLVLSTFAGTANFNNICLSNYGTVEVPGDIDLADNVVFANHGKLLVPTGGRLRVCENEILTPGASMEAKRQPGTANATAMRTINRGQPDETMVGGTLMGGTWEVAGELLIDGAEFAAIGANSAEPTTRSGSIDGSGGVVNDAGEGGNRALSRGRAATVILDGNWSFPAIIGLRENRGTLKLRNETEFPGPTAPEGTTPGDFINKGTLDVGNFSSMTVGGSFIQCGESPSTVLPLEGILSSTTNDFQIRGGTVFADATSTIFNLTGGSIASGTSLVVQSVLRDTGAVDPFTGQPTAEPDRVRIDLGGRVISSIPSGASVEIDGRVTRFPDSPGLTGSGIHFPALTENLSSNAGAFVMKGDGENSPKISFGNFTNSGTMEVLGTRAEVGFADFNQTGGSLRVGAGNSVVFNGSTQLNGGELIVEISDRSPYGRFEQGGGRFGMGFLRNPPDDLNQKLVIDFVGNLAEGSVDIGDTWEIAPRSNTIVGLESVDFRLNGGPIPTDWLPAGSELKIVQFENPNPPAGVFNRGLAIRIAPISGFIDYYTWALDRGLPNRSDTVLADPLADGNGNGILNELEFFFGLNGIDRNSPNQFIRESIVSGDDGQDRFEISFVRLAGVDASFTPYLSGDLVNWEIARMQVINVGPGPADGLERVTLRSESLAGTERVFFRIIPNFNPDNFDAGLLAETENGKYINQSQGLDSLDGVLRDIGYVVGYKALPGRVLYFNVTGNEEGKNSMFGGTAPDGTTRNFIYASRSPLQAAVVHAGVLNPGERGIVKVTLVEPQTTPFIGSEQESEDGTLITSQSQAALSVEVEPYSYKVEIQSFPDGRKNPNINWSAGSSISAGTSLGESQLDATASVPGTFVYTPPLGTPAVGDRDGRMTLMLEFTPADSLRYAVQIREVTINVNAPQP